jgi:hypothetical protein
MFRADKYQMTMKVAFGVIGTLAIAAASVGVHVAPTHSLEVAVFQRARSRHLRAVGAGGADRAPGRAPRAAGGPLIE